MFASRVLRGLCAAALLFAQLAAFAAEDDVVPADKEPRHVPKLVNEWVRLVDVEIPEGEQTMYHRHSFDYPYVLVTSVTLYNQIYGQEPKDAIMEAGFVGYYDAATKGAYTHRFINRGPGVFRAIGIELLKSQATEPGRNVNFPGVEPVVNNERVAAYKFRLAPGASTGTLKIPGPSIRVALGAGSISERGSGQPTNSQLAPAQFVFREQAVTTIVSNTGDTPVEWVEFVLK